MNSIGIRINDSKPLSNGEILNVSINDILGAIEDGEAFKWAILELEATGKLPSNMTIPQLEKEIQNSENGFVIEWKNLFPLSEKFWQVIWITIIGCKNSENIKKYSSDLEMYESCDFVIEVIDGGCCEVFSNDHEFIKRLQTKYSKTELLSTNWAEKD